jgi:hypothetical protein
MYYKTFKEVLTFYKLQNPFEGSSLFYFFLRFLSLPPLFAVFVMSDLPCTALKLTT